MNQVIRKLLMLFIISFGSILISEAHDPSTTSSLSSSPPLTTSSLSSPASSLSSTSLFPKELHLPSSSSSVVPSYSRLTSLSLDQIKNQRQAKLLFPKKLKRFNLDLSSLNGKGFLPMMTLLGPSTSPMSPGSSIHHLHQQQMVNSDRPKLIPIDISVLDKPILPFPLMFDRNELEESLSFPRGSRSGELEDDEIADISDEYNDDMPNEIPMDPNYTDEDDAQIIPNSIEYIDFLPEHLSTGNDALSDYFDEIKARRRRLFHQHQNQQHSHQHPKQQLVNFHQYYLHSQHPKHIHQFQHLYQHEKPHYSTNGNHHQLEGQLKSNGANQLILNNPKLNSEQFINDFLKPSLSENHIANPNHFIDVGSKNSNSRSSLGHLSSHLLLDNSNYSQNKHTQRPDRREEGNDIVLTINSHQSPLDRNINRVSGLVTKIKPIK